MRAIRYDAMKRGGSGLSLVVAVNKPRGMTSHDVVNACRRIFGEKRVGHTGTLDPLATGVLPICIGPATRLDRYMTGHDKSYRVTMAFGSETTTDDSEGEPTTVAPIGVDLFEGDFAISYISGLAGKREQVPPDYSAVKVNGKKAYDLARKGERVSLEARAIEIYHAELVKRYVPPEGAGLRWVVDFSVSKGTYIRSLVRDIGRELGTPAHVHSLERVRSGAVLLEECFTLETLSVLGVSAAIDPVRALGFRFAYADECSRLVENGARLRGSMLRLFELDSELRATSLCGCTSETVESHEPAFDGEHVCVIVENRLKAIYRYMGDENAYKPSCVFPIGIIRG